MKEKYLKLFRKAWYVNSHPIASWEMIKNEPEAPAWYFKHFILPIIIAICSVNFIGYLLFALTIHNFSILYAFIKAVSVGCESFFTFYVTFLIVKELREKLKVEIPNHQLFKIQVYSFTPFWIALLLSGILANYATLSSFLRFMGLYGLFLFLSGMEQWQVVDPKKRTLFAIINMAIAIICYQLINWSFAFVLRNLPVLEILSN